MGYTTDFDGEVEVSPPLNEAEAAYLRKFSETRRMDRERGPFFVGGEGYRGQGESGDVRDNNASPAEQPGLWCQWVPNEDGTALEWDRGEKFYESVDWMEYVIDTFLKPGCTVEKLMEDGQLATEIAEQFSAFTFDHVCNGEIAAQGEDPDDMWLLKVTDNGVEQLDGVTQYGAGLPRPGQVTTDAEALDQLAALLNRPGEWNGGDVCEALADTLVRTGREIDSHAPGDCQ